MADSKQEKSPMEDHYNGSSQSRVVLAKPRLGGVGSFRFASSSNKNNLFSSSVLRPPQLKPAANPFLKVSDNSEVTSEKETEEKDREPQSASEHRLKENNEESEAPKFIPLRSTGVTPRTSNPVAPVESASSSSGFVFGQNLSERVVMNENLNNGEATAVDHSVTNGASELLFTSAAASVKDSTNEKDEAGPSDASNNNSGSSLAAAAAEYERSHARPPPPTTNFTVTGEEDETNVLQISCRLFAWESGSWRERGRGVLRLNDTAGGARLVARVAGSLRVALNTKLWPAMVVERAGAKSLRITASDAQQQVKLFLIMGAPGDINQLHRALTARISVNKRANPCPQNAPSQKAAERLEAAADDSEYLDKANDDVYGREGPSKDVPDGETAERLEPEQQNKTEESNVDDPNKETETKSLKRKEPTEDGTSPKRQCPKILIE